MKKYIPVFLFLLISNCLFSQISHGGMPLAWQAQLPVIEQAVLLPNIGFDPPAYSKQELEKHGAYKFAEILLLNKGTQNSGQWNQLPNGDKVWRLRVKSEGAYSLNFVFSTYKVPPGAKVFVYDISGEQLLGAFTHENKKKSGILAVAPIAGDELIVEYNEPANPAFKGELLIQEVAHDYVGIFGKKGVAGSSGDCNVDINCDDGNDWQKEKRAVCKMLIVNELCSGTLVNNTLEDGTPYVLTANHCIESQEKADKATFIFNYEYTECGGDVVGNAPSISGCDLVATKNKENGYLDFSLVKISEDIPDDYDPYFAGWDSRDNFATSATCIHHPSGDVKKISQDYNAQEVASYWGWGYDPKSFWLVKEWDTGTTEGGSSGSPLFDQNHRIIGSLTGGDANCDSSVNDYYQMFSFSYDKYSDDSMQLKHWLDPNQSGVEYLDGYEPKGFSGEVTDLIAVFNIEEGDDLVSFVAQYDGENAGYVAGNNIYQDQEKAEFFNRTKFDGRNAITGATVAFFVGKGNENDKVELIIYEEDLGLPGKQLGAAELPLSQVISDVENGEFTNFEFDAPILVNGSIFASVRLPMNEGDTVAIVTTDENVVDINSAWELNYNNEWHPYNSDQSWGLALAHFIGIEIGNYTDIAKPVVSESSFKVYPNPVSSHFTVKKNGVAHWHNVAIFDAYGRMVYYNADVEFMDRLELNAMDWKKGFYLVRISTETGLETKKIIIQ